MPTITFIEPNGLSHETDAPVGRSLMQVALDNLIESIAAECGGSCSCGTCHCYIDEPWLEDAGAPDEMEQALLEGLQELKPNSRLSCQVIVTDKMEGMIVRVPEQEY